MTPRILTLRDVLAATTVRTPSRISQVLGRVNRGRPTFGYRIVYAALERLADLGLVRRIRQFPGFRPKYQRLPRRELVAKLREVGR